MEWISIFYVSLNTVWWLAMLAAVNTRSPGTRSVTWSSTEIKVWRSITLLMVAFGAVALLTACGGGDPDDERKNDPSPNCAMRPESCR